MKALSVPALLALVFICLQLPDISTYPLVTTDEAFLSDAALQLVRHGVFRSDLLRMNIGFDGPYFWHPPGFSLAQALIYEIAGFGIWQTRLAAIIFGGLVCGALYRAVEVLTGDRRIALAAGCLPMFWASFLLTARTARMDCGAIFFLLIATTLTVQMVKGKPSWATAFAAGFSIGLAGIFHSIAATWAASLIFAFTLETWRTPRYVILMVLGAAILPAAWLVSAAFHYDAFDAQFIYQLTGRTASLGLLNRVAGDFTRYGREFGRWPTALALLLFMAYLGVRATERRTPFRMLFTTTISAAMVNMMIAGKSFGFYQLYILFPLVLVCAVVWRSALDGAMTNRMHLLGTALYCAMILNAAAVAYIPRVVALLMQTRERDYALQFDALTSRLKPCDQVWGTAVSWFAVLSAGARLDARPEPVPLRWRSAPESARHRFVVMLKGKTFDTDGYAKVGTFGEPLPNFLGSTYSSYEYVYEIWQSTQLPQ
jgi:hypothetical protein